MVMLQELRENLLKMLCSKYALGQTEYYSDNGMYYYENSSAQIVVLHPRSTSTAIETNLLGGSDNITAEMGYELCISNRCI